MKKNTNLPPLPWRYGPPHIIENFIAAHTGMTDTCSTPQAELRSRTAVGLLHEKRVSCPTETTRLLKKLMA